jgi:CopZ-like zinc binding protein
MSNCCNTNQAEGSCATIVAEERSDKDSGCGGCGIEGRAVERQTLLHHVKHDFLDRVNGESYRFCSDSDCEVVYFGDRGTRFLVDDLRELVSTKTEGNKRPICYCFGFTEGDARQQIERTGQSTSPTTISRLIKAGMCACEVRNPAGVCCLGEVNRTVKRLSEQRPEPVESPLTAVADCYAKADRS